LAESFFKLTESSCRWPIGNPQEPGFRFCLAQHAPGSSYCPEHHAVAVGKAQGRLNMPRE